MVKRQRRMTPTPDPDSENAASPQAQKLESALCKVRRDGKPFEAVYGPPMGCDVTVSQRAHCEEYLVLPDGNAACPLCDQVVRQRVRLSKVDKERGVTKEDQARRNREKSVQTRWDHLRKMHRATRCKACGGITVRDAVGNRTCCT